MGTDTHTKGGDTETSEVSELDATARQGTLFADEIDDAPPPEVAAAIAAAQQTQPDEGRAHEPDDEAAADDRPDMLDPVVYGEQDDQDGGQLDASYDHTAVPLDPKGFDEVPTPEQAQGRSADPVRNATRRLWLICVVTLAAAAAALMTVTAVWFTAELPETTLRLRTGEMIDIAPSSAAVTALELVNQQQTSMGGDLSAAGSASQIPASLAGIPVGHALIVLAAALVVAGAALRLTAMFVTAALATVYGLRAHTALMGTVLGERAGGLYVTPAAAPSWFSAAATVVACGALLAAVQAFVLGSRERAQLRQEAVDRGEDPPATLPQSLWAMISIPLQRLGKLPGGNEPETSTDDARR